MNRPLQIGVTGGIGSGKSLICKIFHHLEIPVYDADSRARWLMNNHNGIREEVIANFGSKAYNDSVLNREFLANQVFNNAEKLQKLNSIVHPRVGKDYRDWVISNSSKQYLIKEAALMYESGSHKQLGKIINVHAPAELRIRRVLQRDKFRSKKEVESIISRQLSDDERKQRADFNIINDGHHLVLPQVLELHYKFMSAT